MLKLFARGTRRPSSKLNKFLNTYTRGRFGFVSGKDSWHLIDAEDLERPEGERVVLLAKASSFLLRFCRGEGAEPEAWNALWHFAETGDELLFHARTLAALGYIDREEVDPDARGKLSGLVARGVASSQL